MAEKSRVKVKCKILNIVRSEKSTKEVHAYHVDVECSIGQRVWVKQIFVAYDRPISREKFIHDFRAMKILPPEEDDFLAFVKEDADKPFEIEIDRP